MPQYLALTMCLGYCLFIYWKEVRVYTDISIAIWIPVVWMMLATSRSLSGWIYQGYLVESSGEGSLPDRIILTLLIILGLAVLCRRKSRVRELLSCNPWLLVLYAYMGMSLIWADPIYISFKRYIRTLGDLIMVLVVLTETHSLKAVSSLFRKSFILLVPLSIVLIKYFRYLGTMQPKYWGPNSWIGVTTHKNSLAVLCLLAFLYFLWDMTSGRKIDRYLVGVPYLLMTIYLLNAGGHSRSMTSIAIIPVVCIAYLVLRVFRNDPSRIKPFFVAGILSLLLIWLSVSTFYNTSFLGVAASSIGRDATLTGRTNLWHDLIRLGMQHQLLGAGYGSFWNSTVSDYLEGIHLWRPETTHSGYIQIFLDLGIAGLLLFALLTIDSFRGAIREYGLKSEFGAWRITLLIIAFLHNITEAGFTRPSNLIWLVFLLVAINGANVPSITGNRSAKFKKNPK